MDKLLAALVLLGTSLLIVWTVSQFIAPLLAQLLAFLASI